MVLKLFGVADNSEKLITLKEIVKMLPQADLINDEIELNGKAYRINNLEELGGDGQPIVTVVMPNVIDCGTF